MPFLQIPKEMNDLIGQVQKEWEPLKETDSALKEEDLSSFSGAAGEKDRKNSPDLYTKNALLILDFFVCEMPQVIKTVISLHEEGQVIPAATAINTRAKKYVNHAAFYLDGFHCIPNLIAASDSAKLFAKACVLEWFLKKLMHFHEQHPTVFSPETIFLLGHFVDSNHNQEMLAKISFFTRNLLYLLVNVLPNRKRLSTLTQRIDDYIKLHRVTRPLITEENTQPVLTVTIPTDGTDGDEKESEPIQETNSPIAETELSLQFISAETPDKEMLEQARMNVRDVIKHSLQQMENNNSEKTEAVNLLIQVANTENFHQLKELIVSYIKNEKVTSDRFFSPKNYQIGVMRPFLTKAFCPNLPTASLINYLLAFTKAEIFAMTNLIPDKMDLPTNAAAAAPAHDAKSVFNFKNL